MARFALKDCRGAIPDFTKSIQLEPNKRAEAYLGRGLSVILDASIFAAFFGKELTENEMKAVHEGIRDFTLTLHKNSEIDSFKLKQLFSKRQETVSNPL
jgi:hypothetical protein